MTAFKKKSLCILTAMILYCTFNFIYKVAKLYELWNIVIVKNRYM